MDQLDTRFWEDSAYRATVFEAIVTSTDEELLDAIEIVDASVKALLIRQGVPRGDIDSIAIVDELSWMARKSPECVMYVSRYWMRHLLDQFRQTDGITGAWIHESLHARQQFAQSREYGVWLGYEEGLTEGLTELVLESVGITHVNRTFPYYVMGYEAIARRLQISPEELWRRLWRYPLGSVRAGFLDSIDILLIESGRERFSERSRQRCQLAADALFVSQRRRTQPDPDAIQTLLERIFT